VNETTDAIDQDDSGCIRFAPHLRRPNWRPLASRKASGLNWSGRKLSTRSAPR